MRLKIIFDGKLFLKGSFSSEEELERVVDSYSSVVFGENVIYIPKVLMGTLAGFKTYPDAIALAVDPGAERWYIVEVELARHGTWSHIAPQISKQIVAADNPETREEIARRFLREVENSEKYKKLFEERGISSIQIFKHILEVVKSDPVIVVPIDEIPDDFMEWAKTLKRDVVPIVIEKYTEVNGDGTIYRVASSLFTPSEPSDDKGKLLTKEEFLSRCDEPGRIMFSMLEELAKEKGHEFRPITQSFSYYVVRKNGKKFCPLTLWPTGVTIYKTSLTPENGVTREAFSVFREEVIKIGNLKNTFDIMKMPGLSTKQGELSEGDIKRFIDAFKKLIESVDACDSFLQSL